VRPKLNDLKDCMVTPGNFLKYHIESRPDFNLNLSTDELELVEKNELTFLFDDNGDFQSHIKRIIYLRSISGGLSPEARPPGRYGKE